MGLLSVPSFFFALLVLTGFEPAGTTVAASSVLRPQLPRLVVSSSFE
jgi:hypothetical protein